MTELATPDFAHYRYRYPDGLEEPVARAMYWNAMNRCRSQPYVHRFVISDAFRSSY